MISRNFNRPVEITSRRPRRTVSLLLVGAMLSKKPPLIALHTHQVLHNNMPETWDLVSSPKFGGEKKGGRIDIGSLFLPFSPIFSLSTVLKLFLSLPTVMDNAGFELFCDMIYADFLIVSGLASEVRFHGKRFAWFVSDVTAPDFSWIVNQMIRAWSLLSKPSIFSTSN